MSQSNDIYGVERWGKGLFSINDKGEIALKNPLSEHAKPVSLVEILDSLEERGIATPVLVRCTNMLQAQIQRINQSFKGAIEELGYQNSYQGVFPIKVNQQAQVIDRIVEFGQPYNYGLEAGSKPELLIALGHQLPKDALLICNGSKDAEFIRLALLSLQIGFNTVIVLESIQELDLVLKESKAMGIKPLLGIRIKLTNQVKGNWAASSGDRSAFGMTSEHVVDVIDTLREHDLLDTLILQHFHLGSQVPDINDVRHSAVEAARFFVELCKEGVPLKYLDLGGGMGVDYTGEHRSTENSVNYSVEEYCRNVIESVMNQVDRAGLAHPTIVTESGRATVANSSLLLFNVLSVSQYHAEKNLTLPEDAHELLKDMVSILEYAKSDRLQEGFNDIAYYRSEVRAAFRRGQVSLRTLGLAEQAYRHVVNHLRSAAQRMEWISDDVHEVLSSHTDIYHANFSIFQSLPDAWAIDQIVPVCPIHRLNEAPTRRGIISDITCDSDGKINHFALTDGVHHSLPLHDLRDDEPYYLGAFMVGAYQETLGDLHNLFGDTNVVTIELDENEGFHLLHEVEGDSIATVLSYVEYDPQRLFGTFKQIVESAVSNRRISPAERRTIIDAYRDSLNGYTYYEH